MLLAHMPEPSMRRSLSWLDPTNCRRPIYRQRPRNCKLPPAAPVAIVTGDAHMQTKLELVGLRFVEPPEPG